MTNKPKPKTTKPRTWKGHMIVRHGKRIIPAVFRRKSRAMQFAHADSGDRVIPVTITERKGGGK